MISQCYFYGRKFQKANLVESFRKFSWFFLFCKFDETLKYKYEIINAPLFNQVMAYVLHLNFKLGFVSWIVPNQ